MMELVTVGALETFCTHRRDGMTHIAAQPGTTVDLVRELTSRQFECHFGRTGSTGVAPGTVHRIDLSVMACVATRWRRDGHPAMLVEARMALGARHPATQHVGFMVEGRPGERHLASLDAEVTPQANVRANGQPEIDRRHPVGELADIHPPLHEIQRGAEQLVGEQNVVSALSITYEVDVLRGQSKQAVGRRSCAHWR
jgi:hypothetical protein